MFTADNLTLIGFIVMVGERLVESLKPIFEPLFKWLVKVTGLENDYLVMLFSWIVVGLIGLATGINIFENTIPYPWVGRLLTVLGCAGGSNFFHDWTK
jgi:hypothetical protein